MDDNQKNELHKILIEILDYFVSVCNENHLQYFLLYGTALGAYRHRGFIPWDDDLDIGMPRDDYNKIIELLKENPSEKYKLQFYGNEPNWYLSFSKIRKSNTIFVERIACDIFNNNGIYIDIFPLDYVRDTQTVKYKIDVNIINYLRHGLKFLSCTSLYKEKESKLRFLLDMVITLPLRLCSKHWILSCLNKKCSGNCNRNEAQYLSEYDDLNALSIPIDYYFPACLLEFEGKKYCAPGKIQDYLEWMYGSTYMELPPVEERKTHQPVKIEF